jgi:hypothetical protein
MVCAVKICMAVVSLRVLSGVRGYNCSFDSWDMFSL